MKNSAFVLFSERTDDLVIYPAAFSKIPYGLAITHVDGTWLPGYPLRIDSSFAYSFLFPFFRKHIDKEMLPQYRSDSSRTFDEFDDNLFARNGFSAMREDLSLAVDLLAGSKFDHPLITSIAQHFSPHLLDPNVRSRRCFEENLLLLKANKDNLILYYRDFCKAITDMMNEYPDCNWFCIQGP